MPTKLNYLILTRGSKSYKTSLNCLKAKHQHLSSLVTCDIDLSQVPTGTYLISTFNYTNISYKSTAFIQIKKWDNKKISTIKLDKVGGNLKEYDSNSIHFYFNKKVYAKNLTALKFEDKDKNEYKIDIYNCRSTFDYDSHVYCYGKLKYKAGSYKIINVQYDKEIIKPSNDLNLILAEDLLDIEKAYNYHGRKVCAGRLNSLLFRFKDYAKVFIFLKFSLKM